MVDIMTSSNAATAFEQN